MMAGKLDWSDRVFGVDMEVRLFIGIVPVVDEADLEKFNIDEYDFLQDGFWVLDFANRHVYSARTPIKG